MQVGCGFRIKVVKGRDYVYFWHYEDLGGRSRQIYEYMGPRWSTGTGRRLAEALDGYYATAAEDLRHQLGAHRAAMAALRT